RKVMGKGRHSRKIRKSVERNRWKRGSLESGRYHSISPETEGPGRLASFSGRQCLRRNRNHRGKTCGSLDGGIGTRGCWRGVRTRLCAKSDSARQVLQANSGKRN